MGRAAGAHAPSDADLVARLRAGDPGALALLYDRHVAGIHDFLARFTRDPAAAEDLAQTTFLRIWERRATLRDPSRVRAWLYATAHHLALNYVTRDRRTDSIDDDAVSGIADAAPSAEQEALSREAAELVWAAAASLETRQYAVLDLSVRRGLTTREVADVLGVPVGHAAVLVNRAREALGNAVRYLLVARRREHCDRLAALVPAGVRVLTAQERSAVDHHMRRCERCQDLGRRLTSAAELFGALLPLPLPSALGSEGRQRLVAAVHALGTEGASPAERGAEVGPLWPVRRWPWEGRPAWVVALVLGLLLLVVLGGGSGTAAFVLRGPAQPAQAIRPGTGSAGSLGGGLESPSPSPSASPSADPSPSPSATPSPVAVVPVAVLPTPTPAVTPAPTPSVSTSPTPAPMSVRQITVVWVDVRACPFKQSSQTFSCHFAVTLTLSNANGRDSFAGTLTASTTSGETNTVSFATTPAKGSTSSTLLVTATLKTTACGTASVKTQRPNVVSSPTVRFGTCPNRALAVNLTVVVARG